MKVVLHIDDIKRLLADYVEEHHNDSSREVNESGITFRNAEGVPVPIQEVEIPLTDDPEM